MDIQKRKCFSRSISSFFRAFLTPFDAAPWVPLRLMTIARISIGEGRVIIDSSKYVVSRL